MLHSAKEKVGKGDFKKPFWSANLVLNYADFSHTTVPTKKSDKAVSDPSQSYLPPLFSSSCWQKKRKKGWFRVAYKSSLSPKVSGEGAISCCTSNHIPSGLRSTGCNLSRGNHSLSLKKLPDWAAENSLIQGCTLNLNSWKSEDPMEYRLPIIMVIYVWHTDQQLN